MFLLALTFYVFFFLLAHDDFDAKRIDDDIISNESFDATSISPRKVFAPIIDTCINRTFWI
jgi:hypothetical protein